jgi:hypothetical protein
MNTLRDLIEAGWPVVPLRRGEKAPRPQRWTELTFVESDFEPGDNIGVKTGVPSKVGTLLDVDCDVPEAIAAAEALLPQTLCHGRHGKPRSHYWYLHTGDKEPGSRLFYADLDGSVLIELRGRDHQTLVPPSTHPSGETIRWENDAPLRQIAWTDLEEFVRLTALAALLARHYPSEGGRHDAYLHLGGVLQRLGVTSILAAALVKTLTALTGDDPVDRQRCVRESYTDAENGKRTTGAPRFKESWPQGEALIERINSWYRKTSSGFVAKLNEKHFVVNGMTKMLVGTEDGPHSPVTFQTFMAFRERYLNHYVQVPAGDGTRTVSAGDAWLRSPERRTYSNVVFSPPCSPFPAREDDYNLWRGFAVLPSAENPSVARRSVTRYLAHIHEVVCSGDDRAFHWFLDWMADAVQRPGKLSGKTVALRGRAGSGKSLLFEAFGGLFGQHYLSVSTSDQIVGRFNAHLSGKILIFADEALWGGDRRSAGIFRRLVTQPTLAIERKGVDIFNEPNYLRIGIASNEDWVAPAIVGERRLIVFQMDEVRPRAYFNALFEEIQQPQFLPSLLKVLQSWAIDDTRLTQGIATSALLDQIDLSADPVMQWWAQCLQDGCCTDSPDPTRSWPEWIAEAELYDKFVEDMGRKAGFHYRGTRKAFVQKLAGLLGDRVERARKNVRMFFENGTVDAMRMAIKLPALQDARSIFDRKVGFAREWADANGEAAPDPEPELF